MAGVGSVVAGDDQRGDFEARQLLQRAEGPRTRYLSQRLGKRLGVPLAQYPLPREAQHRAAPALVDPLLLADVGDEAVDAALLQRRRQPVPVLERGRID